MKNKVVKKESLEEFKARGGEVKVYPYHKPEDEEKTTVYPKGPISQDFMSLDDGEFYYSESKPSKKQVNPIKGLIEQLPEDIKSLLVKEFRDE